MAVSPLCRLAGPSPMILGPLNITLFRGEAMRGCLCHPARWHFLVPLLATLRKCTPLAVDGGLMEIRLGGGGGFNRARAKQSPPSGRFWAVLLLPGAQEELAGD